MSLNWKLIAKITILCLFVLGGGVYKLYLYAWTDYSQEAPNQVFQTVFKQDIPKGVSQLKIAGHGFSMSGRVWMSFVATPQIFKQIQDSSGHRWVHELDVTPGLNDLAGDRDSDAITAGWPPAPTPLWLENFHFSPKPLIGWFGDCLVNPKSNRVYVRADLL